MQDTPTDESPILAREALASRRRRVGRGKLLLLFGLVLTPVTIAVAWYFLTDGEDGPAPTATHMVPMRDGVRLATDVYLPNATGAFPVILYRTPYDKDTDPGPTHVLEHGVAVVTQDHRGCHASEGEYTAFGADGRDARDTVAWMDAQPWFNGVLATEGNSARGITQYRQVPHVDAIACQWIEVGTPDLYHHALFQGGAPRKLLAESWLDGIGQGDYYDAVMFEDVLETGALARDHVLQPHDWSNVTWPSVHLGGWYDCFCQGILDGFSGYQYAGGPGGAGNAHLIMGPWTHGVRSPAGGAIVYPDGGMDPWSRDLWNALFAEHLLNTTAYGTHAMFPPVMYYVMGDVDAPSDAWNRWATADAWPVPHANQTWFFTPDGGLAPQVPVTPASFAYTYDPTDPLETRGGQNLVGAQQGPRDQRPVETGRHDLVAFEANLTAPLHVTGRVWATLHVTSNATDTDFVVKLEDVYPDGRCMLVTDGICRARSRTGQHVEVFMDGSGTTVYEVPVDLWSTSYVFNAGHAVRVVVSSSNYPRFDMNPNTGAPITPVNETTPWQVAHNAVVVSPAHPSGIVFPVPTSAPTFASS